MGNLLGELKRRNVIRVAIAYAVAAWLILQVADLVLDNIDAPEWVMQVFMLALALGLPIVLIFSWVYELTPEGLKREKDVTKSESITHVTARKLDFVTIFLLVLVLAVVGLQRFFPSTRDTGEADSAAERSIAVLAFEDLSPEGDQEYFADGISEEILNTLAQIPDIKVAGRTSSFAFKGEKRDLRDIGEALQVAHVLEGSVRKSGDNIRVTAQLVKVADGFHLFSKNYNRKLDDVFRVQDDIAREISVALKSAILGGEEGIVEATPTLPETYTNYLRARQWIQSRNATLMAQATELLDHALAVDPDYAPALALKATAIILLSESSGGYGDIPAREAQRLSRPLIDRALALDPRLAEAHAALGLWHMQFQTDQEPAIASLRDALAINPNLVDANNWLATALSGTGRDSERRLLLEAVVDRDPLYGPAFTNLVLTYVDLRELEKVETLIHRIERITGTSPNVQSARGVVALMTGDPTGAIESLRLAYEFNPNNAITSSFYGSALLIIGDYETASVASYVTNRLLPLELSGRHDQAEALLDTFRDSPLDSDDLWSVTSWYAVQDRAADLVGFMEDHVAEGRALTESFPASPAHVGAPERTNLVVALRKVGRLEEADELLGSVEEILARQLRGGADNIWFWINYAEYEALTGNPESMYAYLEKAIDRGYVSVLAFYQWSFDAYREEAQFVDLENRVRQRADEERRKLGLPDKTDFGT